METQTTQPVQRRHGVARFKGFRLTDADEPLIAKLSPEQQAAIRAKGTVKEIATQLNCAIGTAKSRVHRAKAALVTLRNMAS